MANTAILVGAGEADRRPRPGRTAGDLAVESAVAALADAGLTNADIDGVVTGYSLSENHLDFSAFLSQELGIRPSWSATVSRSGATGASLVVEAAMAVLTGACTTALAVWADNRASAPASDIVGSLAGQFSSYEMAYGPLVATQYALVAGRYQSHYGVTPEQMAAVSVSFRDHASRNPEARHRDRITVDDVLASPMVTSPLHRLECTLVTDFGGAVVVTTKDRARSFDDPVDLLGFGESSTHESILCAPDLFSSSQTGAKQSGEHAFRMAGLTPADVESAQLYDCFSVTVLLLLEDLGFCARGEAGAAVAEGMLSRDGSLPSNTNGGMLSCANGGILHVTEAVAQMRGTAGVHQLPARPQTSLVHGNGGILATHATLLLGRH